MAIILNLDVMLAKRKMRLNELSDAVGITIQNLSILKTGKARAVRFSTLNALCRALECQPGDILEYKFMPTDLEEPISEQDPSEGIAAPSSPSITDERAAAPLQKAKIRKPHRVKMPRAKRTVIRPLRARSGRFPE